MSSHHDDSYGECTWFGFSLSSATVKSAKRLLSLERGCRRLIMFQTCCHGSHCQQVIHTKGLQVFCIQLRKHIMCVMFCFCFGFFSVCRKQHWSSLERRNRQRVNLTTILWQENEALILCLLRVSSGLRCVKNEFGLSNSRGWQS